MKVYAVFFLLGTIALVIGINHPGTEGIKDWVKPRFPYLSNVLYNTGVGPITTTDVYHYGLPDRPFLSPAIWNGLTFLFVSLSVFWWFFAKEFRRLYHDLSESFEKNLLLFCLYFIVLSEVLTIHSYDIAVFDRYHFPVLLASSLLLGFFCTSSWQKIKRFAIFLTGGLVLIWALFSFTAIHDYFEWNSIRWHWVESLLKQGVSPKTIDGGFEVNGWLAFDRAHQKIPFSPKDCIGSCVTDGVWYTRDTSYRIVFNVLPGYEVLEEKTPQYWLVNGPSLKLIRRKAP